MVETMGSEGASYKNGPKAEPMICSFAVQAKEANKARINGNVACPKEGLA